MIKTINIIFSNIKTKLWNCTWIWVNNCNYCIIALYKSFRKKDIFINCYIM